MDTDWTSFADDWRGLYQPQMHRVRKGELPWTNIDELHKEAFEMLLTKRGLKHPGEEGSWEFTRLWHKLRPWPDSVEGIGMMKKKYVVATLSNGNVALLINMAKNGGIPWDHCFSGETFQPLQARSRILPRRGQDHVPAAAPGDAVRGAQRRPEGGAEMRPVDRLRAPAHGARPEPEDRPQGRRRMERRRRFDDRAGEEAGLH